MSHVFLLSVQLLAKHHARYLVQFGKLLLVRKYLVFVEASVFVLGHHVKLTLQFRLSRLQADIKVLSIRWPLLVRLRLTASTWKRLLSRVGVKVFE